MLCQSIMPAKIFNMPVKIRILWIAGPGAAQPDACLLAELNPAVVEVVGGGSEALRRVEARGADVLVASFPLPAWTPAELLEEMARIDSGLPVLVLTEPPDAAEIRPRLQAAFETRTPFSVPCAPAPWKQFLVG